MSERETAVELPWAADCCPCVEKLRTVLPFTVGIRDGVVQLVSTLGSAVISARARAELGTGTAVPSSLEPETFNFYLNKSGVPPPGVAPTMTVSMHQRLFQ